MSKQPKPFQRPYAKTLSKRLNELRRFVQVITGPSNQEVDFIVKAGRRLTAIEVKSGRAPQAHAGTAAFAESFKVHRTLLVGGDGVGVEDFLLRPVTDWA